MNQKEYIGKKIKEYRKEIPGLSASKLGNMLSHPVSSKTIYSWESGRTQPSGDELIELCIIFGVKISDFYFKPKAYLEEVDAVSSNPEFVEVPLLGRIAAGQPIEMDEVENTIAIPQPVHAKYPNSFLLTVDGESMNRILPNGSYALINPVDEIRRDNAPYAVCVNGYDATIKRVHRLNHGFELVPDSTDPTFVPTIYDYNDPTTDLITVIGEVVWYTLPYDWSF